MDLIFEVRGAENAFRPAKTLYPSMTILLKKEGHTQTAIDSSGTDALTDLDGDLEDDDNLDSCSKISMEDEEGLDLSIVEKWLPPLIPSNIDFRGRPSHVDNFGQIYMHLKENESKLERMNETITKMQFEPEE